VTFDLTSARLNAGLSMRGLADAVDVAEQTIRRLEDGEGVHPANAKKVADYFGIKVTDLLPVEREAA
jgi:ribosome-binding protein aMBF1 (putative translation factor)